MIDPKNWNSEGIKKEEAVRGEEVLFIHLYIYTFVHEKLNLILTLEHWTWCVSLLSLKLFRN